VLRKQIGYDRPNLFVTNRREKVVKLYDDENKMFGSRLSASVFRRMVESSGRDHGADTSAKIARVLQHTDGVADRFYRLPLRQ